MRPGRSEADQAVSRRHPVRDDDFVLLDHADGETRQIVIAGAVHAGHLGGFAADQRAAGLPAARADPADDLGGNVDIERAGGVIVEEEQRLGAADDEIVDAHGDQIDADAVVPAEFQRQLELGAHAVRRRDEHRLPVARRKLAKAAESADIGEHFGPAGGLDGRTDPAHESVAEVDVDAGVAIAQGSAAGRRLVLFMVGIA